MASTFFGLAIGASGLSTYQAALNTTGNNISNVKTKGYSRQVALQQASEALRSYTSNGMLGSGVTTTGITQIRNIYYDVKYWNNSTNYGEYSTKNYYMNQIEDYFEEENKDGFTVAFDEMFTTLEEVYKNSSDLSVRNQFINSAESFTEYFNGLATSLSSIQKDANEEIKNKIFQVNTIAQEIASLTKQINVIELTGAKANDLRDQRALLVDELSAIVPIEVTENEIQSTNESPVKNGGTTYVITIQGHILVDSFNYNTLAVVSREDKVNQSDIAGLYDALWEDGNSFNLNSLVSGELRGLIDIRDGNNQDNFKGTIKGTGKDPITGNTTVTISGASITEINKMTMAESGTIFLNNKEYTYSGFTYNTTTKEYTFTLTEKISAPQSLTLSGKMANIGESVDYMGIPYYMSQLNEFVRAFAEAFNNIHTTGQDLNGKTAKNFFTGGNIVDSSKEYDPVSNPNTMSSISGSAGDSYYYLTAANFTVSKAMLADARLLSTTKNISLGVSGYDITDKLIQLKSDTVLFRGGYASEFLQSVLSDIAVDTQKVSDFEKNYSIISKAIVNQRLSVSGVDSDEEALNLVKYQNAYNLCAKMVSVMTEIYDKLIEETGV